MSPPLILLFGSVPFSPSASIAIALPVLSQGLIPSTSIGPESCAPYPMRAPLAARLPRQVRSVANVPLSLELPFKARPSASIPHLPQKSGIRTATD
jgi:hypothetical protein